MLLSTTMGEQIQFDIYYWPEISQLVCHIRYYYYAQVIIYFYGFWKLLYIKS